MDPREVNLDLSKLDEEPNSFDWTRCSPEAEDFEGREEEGCSDCDVADAASSPKEPQDFLGFETLATPQASPATCFFGEARQSLGAEQRSRPQTVKDGKGDVSLCVRLKPGVEEEVAEVEANSVRLKSGVERSPLSSPTRESFTGGGSGDCVVCCDHAFGPAATQEEVFERSVSPIADAVIKGYNGAVIAYGQTGAGKTHTMIGAKSGDGRGVAPRAIAAIFAGLARRASWRVEVSVLEIYNEKVRDLLAPGSNVNTVEIHEIREREGVPMTFRCPDATTWLARTPEEALQALAEGCRRREVARTDMNHHSSRSHLVYSLNVTQTDREAGATIRSRLHLVDLAGSERLKRSMACESPSRRSSLQSRGARGSPIAGQRSPRDQRREAGEINKSLSQLALVIQRLTSPGGQYVPYRDSMLTRLLAESFGGSSKTCLIIACSPAVEDRDETRGSLDFGRRAKLVRNKPQINIEVESEPSAVMKAILANELLQVQLERDALITSRDGLLAENSSLRKQHEKAASAATTSQEASLRRCLQLEDQAVDAQRLARDATEAYVKLEEDRARMQAAYEEKVAEQKRLLKVSGDRVAALLEEQASLERSNFMAAQEALKKQENQAAAAGQLEERMLSLRSEWQAERAVLEQSKAALQQQHGHQISDLVRQLSEARSEAARLQEERATAAQRAQEDRSALLRHWHEEVMRLREEKVSATTILEEEKMSLRRRSQAEVSSIQAMKDSAIAELEKEKAGLREKWQAALEEISGLQARLAGLESKCAEDLAAKAAVFEADKAELRRQCMEELGRLLEEKAAEAAKHELERVALHRRLDVTVAALETDKASIEVRLEADKAELQGRLQEVFREKLELLEKASWSQQQDDHLQESWREAFAKDLEAAKTLRVKEASRLEAMVSAANARQQDSQIRISHLEAELSVLRQRLQSKEAHRISPPTSPSGGIISGGGSPPRRASISLLGPELDVKLVEKVAEPTHEVDQEEAEPEEPCAEDAVDKAEMSLAGQRHPPNCGLWSPSLADLLVGTEPQEEACCNQEGWDLAPRRIELDLTA